MEVSSSLGFGAHLGGGCCGLFVRLDCALDILATLMMCVCYMQTASGARESETGSLMHWATGHSPRSVPWTPRSTRVRLLPSCTPALLQPLKHTGNPARCEQHTRHIHERADNASVPVACSHIIASAPSCSFFDAASAPSHVSVPRPIQFRPAMPYGGAPLQLLPHQQRIPVLREANRKHSCPAYPYVSALQPSECLNADRQPPIATNARALRASGPTWYNTEQVDHPATTNTLAYSSQKRSSIDTYNCCHIGTFDLARCDLSLALMPPAPRCISPHSPATCNERGSAAFRAYPLPPLLSFAPPPVFSRPQPHAN